MLTLSTWQILSHLLLWPGPGTPEQRREAPHAHRLFVALLSVEFICLKVIARK